LHADGGELRHQRRLGGARRPVPLRRAASEQQQANNISRCFNWFQGNDISRGQGEAESIAQMVRRMLADTAADQARVSVTGLSAAAR